MPRARSDYRQVRLTVTDSPSGDWQVMLSMKPKFADWTTAHILDSWIVDNGGRILTPEDAVVAAVISLSERNLLPGHMG